MSSPRSKKTRDDKDDSKSPILAAIAVVDDDPTTVEEISQGGDQPTLQDAAAGPTPVAAAAVSPAPASSSAAASSPAPAASSPADATPVAAKKEKKEENKEEKIEIRIDAAASSPAPAASSPADATPVAAKEEKKEEKIEIRIDGAAAPAADPDTRPAPPAAHNGTHAIGYTNDLIQTFANGANGEVKRPASKKKNGVAPAAAVLGSESEADDFDMHSKLLAKDDEARARDATTWRRTPKFTAVQFLNISAVAFEFIFAWFVYDAIMAKRELTLSEMRLDSSTLASVLYKVFAILGVTANLACDLVAAHPTSEAADAVSGKPADEKLRGRGFAQFLKYMSMFSYFTLGTSDAIPIAEKTDSYFLKGLTGATFIAPALAYYHMLQGGAYGPHVDAFIKAVTGDNPAYPSSVSLYFRRFEAFFRVLSNISYRSVVASFTAISAAGAVAKLSETDNATLAFAGLAAGTTALSVAFSRTLRVLDKFSNDNFRLIEDDELEAAKKSVPLRTIGFDLLFPLIARGLPVSWLFYNHSLSNPYARAFLSAGAGLAIFIPSAYALYNTSVCEIAVEKVGPANLKKRADNYLSTPLNAGRPSINSDSKQGEKGILDNKKLLKMIIESRKNVPIKAEINSVFGYLNNMSGFTRLWMYYSFVAALQAVAVKLGADPVFDGWDRLALTLLCGASTIVADRAVYGGWIAGTLDIYDAQYAVGAPSKALKQSSWPIRALSSFFTPIEGYDPKVLGEGLRNAAAAGAAPAVARASSAAVAAALAEAARPAAAAAVLPPAAASASPAVIAFPAAAAAAAKAGSSSSSDASSPLRTHSAFAPAAPSRQNTVVAGGESQPLLGKKSGYSTCILM